MSLFDKILGFKAEKNEARIEQVESDIDELLEISKTLSQEVEELKNSKAESSEVEALSDAVDDLSHRIHDLEPITVDVTPRERDVLEVLLREEGWVATTEISDRLDVSTSNVRALLSRLSNKVDVDKKTQGRRKQYCINEREKKEILGK